MSEDVIGSGEQSEDNLYYFTASPSKFIVMSTCTMGLYEIYWFYKNWTLIKQREQSKIMPVWRSIFGPLWTYSLLKRVQQTASEQGTLPLPSVGFFAFLYFVLSAAYKAPDPYWLISIFSFFMLMPGNSSMIAINQKLVPNYVENSKYSGWNWFGIILGGLIMILGVLSVIFPE